MENTAFSLPIRHDGQALLKCLRYEGTPDRVHHMELYQDREIEDKICDQYGVLDTLDRNDKHFDDKRKLTVQRFLGYDYVSAYIENYGIEIPPGKPAADSTTQSGTRTFVNEHSGPISNWDDFEMFPWPKAESIRTDSIEWFQKNLPDDMILSGGLTSHFYEELSWLFGYESLCYALCEKPDLVEAIVKKLTSAYAVAVEALLQFDRIQMVWGSDDMGFKTGLSIGPDDMRKLILPAHKQIAQLCHSAGRLYLLHSCGKLEMIMEDLISDVRIDAKHSFEDTIESVIETKKAFSPRCAFIGGIDVDFLCRSTPGEIRQRVRRTIDACQPGGGWALGSGNSIASYVPIENYRAMVDEGNRYGA